MENFLIIFFIKYFLLLLKNIFVVRTRIMIGHFPLNIIIIILLLLFFFFFFFFNFKINYLKNIYFYIDNNNNIYILNHYYLI